MSEAIDQPTDSDSKLFGPVAAVFLAAGVASLILGILTTTAEISEGVKSGLEWSKPVGPLTGKVVLSSIGFFLAWGILYAVLKDKDPRPKSIWMWTSILVIAGIVLTFPLVFQAFA